VHQGGPIQHPGRQNNDHTRRRLDVDNLATGALLTALLPNPAPVQCVPTVMDLDFLPDMGRMNGRFALGRKAWLFAGSDRGGERAAIMYTLILTARLNGVDPQAWLADVLDRINDHKIKDLAALLPWHWAPEEARRRPAA
jgi:hypothetical protein